MYQVIVVAGLLAELLGLEPMIYETMFSVKNNVSNTEHLFQKTIDERKCRRRALVKHDKMLQNGKTRRRSGCGEETP